MAIDAASVITGSVTAYKDMTRAMALVYLQEIFDDLSRYIRFTSDSEDIALLATQRLYALNANIVKVYSAELVNGTSYSRDLALTSIRSEERYRTRFRLSVGTPREVYQEASATGARQVGVYPTPDATAILSYPTLRLWVSRRVVLADTGASFFPEAIDDKSVLVCGVLWRHARLRHADEEAIRKADYLKELASLQEKVSNLLIDVQPRNDPYIGSIFRRY